MINTNVTQFRKNVFEIVEQTIRFNEPVNISTKSGNAVLLSAEDYEGLIETMYLVSVPEVKQSIQDGLNTPIEECLPEDEVTW